MKVDQKVYSDQNGWETIKSAGIDPALFDLVLAFGSTDHVRHSSMLSFLQRSYPNATLLLNSTAGEITDTQVGDNTLTLTAIHFEKTVIEAVSTNIASERNSFELGKKLADNLERRDLVSVFVISDGQKVNGSELVRGLQAFLPSEVLITGGLAGDGNRFETTYVGLNKEPASGNIVAVGFYGKNLVVGSGSQSGWNPFGPERMITKSANNILYELDGAFALDVYKKYLGDYAKELPGSALYFPLSIRFSNTYQQMVRTVLSIDEKEKAMIFAGSIPQGAYARMMTASPEHLINGAELAARNSLDQTTDRPQLAILISCVGRKLVLNHRVEEEVEIIRDVYGEKTVLTGFYSYGEITCNADHTKCEMQNQTMTITTLTEK